MHAGDLGDHIGMESCIDLDTDTYSGGGASNRKPWGLNKRRSSFKNVKELPPPLPMQPSTVLKRYYTDDRRLIIAEEKIDSPKYRFTAHRSNGRLTLQLTSSESICYGNDVVASGEMKCVKYNSNVRVAATGPCLFVDQNQLHALRPVQI